MCKPDQRSAIASPRTGQPKVGMYLYVSYPGERDGPPECEQPSGLRGAPASPVHFLSAAL